MRLFTALAVRLAQRARCERLEREVLTLKRALARSIGETRVLRDEINAAGDRPSVGHWVPLAEHMQLAHDVTMARFRVIELEEERRASRR